MIKYNNIEIEVYLKVEDSLKHIEDDYKVLEKEGIEDLIKKSFIPWLKGDKFNDLDDEKIYNGLKLYNISYHYHHIIDKYSPTKQDGYFGEFEFDFENSDEYTKKLLDAAAFVVLVGDGKIYLGQNFDI